MNFLIVTFADDDKKDRNYMTTYQVRKVVNEKDYTDEMLVDVAFLCNATASRQIAIVLTDEAQPKKVKSTMVWKGIRFIDEENYVPLNLNVFKIVRN